MKPLLTCCLIFLTLGSPAMTDNKITSVQLAAAVGLSTAEINCISNGDRACLFSHFNTDVAIPTPLRGRSYHDSLTWAKIAVLFRDAGGSLLESDPPQYFAFTKRAAVFFDLAANTRQRNYALQNLGFMYDETLGKPDSSLHFINLALGYWEEANDTLNRANLYKYKAYLASQMDLPSGHADGHMAIRLFRSKNNEAGAMVSYRDLACLFIKEGKTDSANYYLRPAKEFWQTRGDNSRVFGINTDLIRANGKDLKLASRLIEENELLRFGSESPPIMLRIYYNTVLVHARNIKDKRLEDKFAALSLSAK